MKIKREKERVCPSRAGQYVVPTASHYEYFFNTRLCKPEVSTPVCANTRGGLLGSHLVQSPREMNMHDRRLTRAQRARWRNSRANARRVQKLEASKTFDQKVIRSDHGNVENSFAGLGQSTDSCTSKKVRRVKISNVLEQVTYLVRRRSNSII